MTYNDFTELWKQVIDRNQTGVIEQLIIDIELKD